MNLNSSSAFWNFNLGHAITIAVISISAIGGYFRMDGRVTALEVLSTNNSVKIDKIDDGGTKHSQISEAELRGKMDEMNHNMLILMSRIPEVKK